MNQATYTVQDAAKHIGIGPNTLFKKLRAMRILNKQNIPYQRYISAGYLAVKSEAFTHPTIGEKLYARAMVTHKGINWLLNKFKDEKQ